MDGQLRWLLAQRPGALDAVLSRSFGGEQTPYEWLVRVVPTTARRVLVVACGTGGLNQRLAESGRLVVGLDWSQSALAEAKHAGVGSLVQADANYLPFADETFDTVLSDIGLGVNENRDLMLAEVSRVLRPGGMFAGLAPSHRPTNLADLKTLTALGIILHRMPHVPGESEFRVGAVLEAAGLTKAEDSRARFYFTITGEQDAQLLLSGLRATDDPDRVRKAVSYLSDLAREHPVEFPLPFRRILALK